MKINLFDAISQFGQMLQQCFFPAVEEETGPLSEKNRQLITVLAMIGLEGQLGMSRGGRGRPPQDRLALARAFVAKAILDLPTTEMLIRLLGSDTALRRICGWENQSRVPDKTVFSRAFKEFAESELPQRVHEALIRRTQNERLIGHISRDATAIAARERVEKVEVPVAAPAAQPRPRRKRGEPKWPEQLTRIERQRSMKLPR